MKNPKQVLNENPKRVYSGKDEYVEMNILWLSINESDKNDNFDFYCFYAFLEEFLMISEDLSQKPNFGLDIIKSALLQSHYKNDNDAKCKLEHYFCNEYYVELQYQWEALRTEFVKHSAKLPKHISVNLRYERCKEISMFKQDFYGKYDKLVMQLKVIKRYKYEVAYLKTLIEEKNKEKKKFILGIALSIVGTIATFIFGILPLLGVTI